jgi:hypothetical protein
MILGEELLTWIRPGAGAWVAGKFVPGDNAESTLFGSVQPAGPDELQILSEGERRRSPRRIYTTTQLQTASQQDATLADRVEIDGALYEVHSVERERGILPHYKVIALRFQEGAPPPEPPGDP